MLRPMPLAVRHALALCGLLFFIFALIGALAASTRIDFSAAASGNGTVVLAGHRDTHFSFLKNLVPRDRLVLTDREGRFGWYGVISMTLVRPECASSRWMGSYSSGVIRSTRSIPPVPYGTS